MADSFTPGYNFILPEVGASLDTWGTKLNQNIDELDTLLRMFVGMVSSFPSTDAALPGWLKCDGQEVSRSTYDRLWDWAETHGQVAAAEPATDPGKFGPGDGSTTFSLPDLRGYVIRAFDDGAGVDTGRTFGSTQADQNKSHDHGGGGATSAAGGHDHTASTGSAGSHNHGGATGSDGGHSHTTGSAGSHNHSGSANSAGNHNHHAARDNDSSSNLTSSNSISQSGLGGSGSPNQYGLQGTTAGSFVGDTSSTGAHTHSLSINSNGSHTHSVSTASDHTHTISTQTDHTHTVTVDSVSDHTHTLSLTADGGTETRVKNIALSMYIKT